MSPCEGYACPPTHSVPSGDVVVHTVSTLAQTGIDPVWIVAGLVVGVLLVIGGWSLARRS